MNQITDQNGQEWVISRERNNVTELVHKASGMLVKVPTSQIPRDKILKVEKRILTLPSFSERSRDFLTQLRQRREGAMLARIKAARSKKDPNKPKTPQGSTRGSRSSKRQQAAIAKLDATLEAKLASLPPEQRELAKKLWKGL